MRTQFKATRLCVFGVITFLIGYPIGCTGEQPADNVESGKKATSSPDPNHDLMEKDATEKDATEKDAMKKGMMKKDMKKKDMKKTNSGAALP